MTSQQGEELLRTLKNKALTLEDLHERVRTWGSTWSPEQLLLFLQCAPGVQHDTTTGTFHIESHDSHGNLQDAIIEAVRSFAGKPVSAAQVRVRLPNHFVTTNEQIIALARRTTGIEVFGPNLIRKVQ